MQITLGELLNKIVAAQQRMSRKNPHKLLLQQCAEALIDLMYRLEPFMTPRPESGEYRVMHGYGTGGTVNITPAADDRHDDGTR